MIATATSAAKASFLNYGIRKQLEENLWREVPDQMDDFWKSLIDSSEAFKKTSGKNIVVDVIRSLSPLDAEDDTAPIVDSGYFKKAELSQEEFNALIRDPAFPEELKREIEKNPYYSAADDLLSDWF